MLRPSLRPYLAGLLLLCLTRLLLPEAWALALHAHAHTTEEPARAQSQRRPGTALLTPSHTHCHAEQCYDVPWQLAPALAMPLPPLRLRYRPLAVPVTLACSATARRRSALRGPPTKPGVLRLV